MDWDPSTATHATVHGDLYDGRIGQPAAADIAVSGRNIVGRWTHTVSASSDVTAALYYDRTHRDIPGTFAEDLDIYDVDLQHRLRLGTRHDVVWGLGYRLMNDHVTNSSLLAFLPPHVTREWFTGFVQDEIAIVPDRFHLDIGTKVEHNDYTGVEVQPSARVNWTLSPAGTMWAAASRALRTPSRVDREFFVPGQAPYVIAGGPDFDSEEELAYELGYRHQSGSVALSVATFYNRYSGLRSLEQVSPPTAFRMAPRSQETIARRRAGACTSAIPSSGSTSGPTPAARIPRTAPRSRRRPTVNSPYARSSTSPRT